MKLELTGPVEFSSTGEVIILVLAVSLVLIALPLLGGIVLVVGTTRRDGSPHAAMSSFALADGRVWLPTEAGTLRISNLQRNPYVSLALTEGEDETHAVVLIGGPVTLVPDGDAPTARAAWKDKFSHELAWADRWICVDPRRLFSYAASKWSLV